MRPLAPVLLLAMLLLSCKDRGANVAPGSPTPRMGTPEAATSKLQPQPNAAGPGGLGNKGSDGDGGVP
jgi:hypothetical protein